MTFIETFFSLFWYVNSWRISPIPRVSLNESAFPAFLEIDISGNSFEVPTPIIPYVRPAKRAGYTKLVYSLINGEDSMGRRTFHKKTASSIFRQFNNTFDDNMRLAHVITSKNLHYYGCRGMIFNENYEPLMLGTLEVNYDAYNDTIKVSHPRCLLSYKVFENASEVVEKAIIKQALPYYANNNIDIAYNSEGNYNIPIEVTVKHLNSMVVKPAAPTLSTATITNFNNTITNYYKS